MIVPFQKILNRGRSRAGGSGRAFGRAAAAMCLTLLSVSSIAAGSASANDFTVQTTGILGDRVWLDTDFDGVFDAGEVGLAGIDVTADWNDGGPQSTTVTTDADGIWSIGSLSFNVPITISVNTAQLPGNLAQTHDADDPAFSGPIGTPDQATVTLTAGSPTRDDIDFGYVGLGQVGDLVWFDIDGDGASAPEVEDILLEDVDVTATWSAPNGGTDLAVAATTDENGFWVAQGLPDGVVDISFDMGTLPAGIVNVVDPDGGLDSTSQVTLFDDPGTGPNEAAVFDQDFAWTGGGSIADRVWHDADGDGLIGGAETGLAAMTVEVRWTDGGGTERTWTDVTDATGNYLIGGLPSGFISVSVPTAGASGLVATYDADGANDGVANITLAVGENRTDVDFGFRNSADIRVTNSHVGDFRIGETNVWEVEVENLGPGDATGPMVVTATLPTGASFFGLSGPGASAWDCVARSAPNDHILDCTYQLSDLVSGNSSAFELVASIDGDAVPAATLDTTVSSNSFDGALANNSDSDTATVPLAEMSVSMTRLDDLVAGDVVTYRMGVTNNGPSVTSGGITLTDDLPTGLAFDTANGDGWTCGPSNGDVVCIQLGVIPVGATAVVDLDLVVLGSAGDSVVNSVVVTGGNEVNGTQLDAGALQAAVGTVEDSLTETIQAAGGGGGTTTSTTTTTTTTTAPGGGGTTTTTTTTPTSGGTTTTTTGSGGGTTTTTSGAGGGSTTSTTSGPNGGVSGGGENNDGGGAGGTGTDDGSGTGAGDLAGDPDELARTGVGTLMFWYSVLALALGALMMWGTRPIRRPRGSNPIL